MKKNKLLILTAALLLVGCGNIQNNENSLSSIKEEEQKVEVKKLYEDSLDTAEELDSFSSSEEENVNDSIDDNTEISEDISSEVDSNEEISEEESSETDTSVEDEKEEITSYHVDYVVDYSLGISLMDSPFYSFSEKQIYSLTYVKLAEDNIYLDLSTKYVYEETYSYIGYDYTSKLSHEIGLKYQDNYLYVTQKLGDQDGYKTKHNIDINRLRDEYDDYLIYTSINAMFDPSSRDSNSALVDELLTNDTVKIVDSSETSVTIEFDYEDGIATMIFDTTLNAFTSVTFDKSKEAESVDFDKVLDEEIDSPSYDFIDDEDDDNEIFEDFEDELDDYYDDFGEIDDVIEDYFEDEDDKHHHNHGKDEYDISENNPFTINDYTYIVKMDFSYNDQEADLLTEEEKAEYIDFSFDYKHENNFHGNENHGYHGGKDEHHHDNYKPNHKDVEDYEDDDFDRNHYFDDKDSDKSKEENLNTKNFNKF